jgi:hypothetical protein
MSGNHKATPPVERGGRVIYCWEPHLAAHSLLILWLISIEKSQRATALCSL